MPINRISLNRSLIKPVMPRAKQLRTAPLIKEKRGPMAAASHLVGPETYDTINLYLEGIRKYNLLSFREEIAFSKKAHTGDENAKNRLITSNLGLVISIAKKYISGGMPLPDLIQEGSLGLITAIDKFDPGKKLRFSTYATYWIRQAITRSIDEKQRMIRLPVYVLENIRKINKAIEFFHQKFGRQPTVEEISKRTGISLVKVKKYLTLSRGTLSLEMPIGDDEMVLGDVLKDNSPPPDQTVLRMFFLKAELEKAMSCLSDRERLALRLRYGERKSVKEIMDVLHLVKSNVHRILRIAEIKLRRSPGIDNLKYFLF